MPKFSSRTTLKRMTLGLVLASSPAFADSKPQDMAKTLVTVSNTWVKAIGEMAYKSSQWITQAITSTATAPQSSGLAGDQSLQKKLGDAASLELVGSQATTQPLPDLSDAAQLLVEGYLSPLIKADASSSGDRMFSQLGDLTVNSTACVTMNNQKVQLTLDTTDLLQTTKKGLQFELIASQCQADLKASSSEGSGSTSSSSSSSSGGNNTSQSNMRAQANSAKAQNNKPLGDPCSATQAQKLIKQTQNWAENLKYGSQASLLTTREQAALDFITNLSASTRSSKVLVIQLGKILPQLKKINERLRDQFAEQVMTTIGQRGLKPCDVSLQTTPLPTPTAQGLSANLLLGQNTLYGAPGSEACTNKKSAGPDMRPYAQQYLRLIKDSANLGNLALPSLPLSDDQIVGKGKITTLKKGVSDSATRTQIQSFRMQEKMKIKDLSAQFMQLAKGTVAARNMALSNLNHLYGLRSTAITSGLKAQDGTALQCTPQETAYHSATWRLQGDWLTHMQSATPANVSRQMLMLLAEIRYQLFLNNLEQQRALATLSLMQLSQTKSQATQLKDLKSRIDGAVQGYIQGQQQPASLPKSN